MPSESFCAPEGCGYSIGFLTIVQLLIVDRLLFRGMAECTCHLEPFMASLPTIIVTNAQILTEFQVCSIVEQMESDCPLHQPVKVNQCMNCSHTLVMCIN